MRRTAVRPRPEVSSVASAPRSPGRRPLVSVVSKTSRLLSGPLVLLGACAGPVPDLAPAATVAAQLRLDRPIEILLEGEPVDLHALPPAVPLDQARACAEAVHHAPELQAALARVDAALADAEGARKWANPLLAVVLRFGTTSPQYEAALTQPFVQMLATPTRAEAADHRLQAAAAAVLTTALDVLADAQQRHAEACAADARHHAGERLVQVQAQVLARLEQRLLAGEVDAAAVAAARHDLAEAQLDLQQLANERRQARLRLAERLGRPGDAAAWPLDAEAPPELAVPEEYACVAMALQHRPELQQRRWELAALGADERLAAFTPWSATTLGAETQRTPAWFTGPNAALPLPVFDDGSKEQQAIAAGTRAAAHELVAASRLVVQEVRTAHAALLRARDQEAAIATTLVAPLLEQLARTRAAVAAGELGRDHELAAELALLAAEARRTAAQHQRRLASFRLQRALGGADPSTAPLTVATSPTAEDR